LRKLDKVTCKNLFKTYRTLTFVHGVAGDYRLNRILRLNWSTITAILNGGYGVPQKTIDKFQERLAYAWSMYIEYEIPRLKEESRLERDALATASADLIRRCNASIRRVSCVRYFLPP